jgi:carboxyl-terminal processing protease
MPHYQRNIRFILFLILPILGFLLGWSLSQKNNDSLDQELSRLEANQEEIENLNLNAETAKPAVFRKTDPKSVDLSTFWEVWHLAEANFLRTENFDTQAQVYGATKGLVESLDDPYTVFMTPEESADFEESMSGEFEGVGAEIDRRDDQIIIVSPLKGSPAESAGLESGDIVFEIDEEPTFGITLEEAVTRIRGPKGEPVVLTVIRENERKPIDITIVRDNIVMPTLEWEINDDDIAVISLYQFGNNAVRDFRTAVESIVLESPKGIVVDLRNNGGGLLDACIKILSEFVKDEVVVRTEGRRFGDTGDLKTGRDGSLLEVPLVVLVNEGSASASEIFAGAVQDLKRGLVVGRKTFGKGSVQNVIPLANGANLKITVSEWLTPAGRSIQKHGIDPHVEVEFDEDQPEEYDQVLEKALSLIGTSEMYELMAQGAPAPEASPEGTENVEVLENDPEPDTNEVTEETNLDETP